MSLSRSFPLWLLAFLPRVFLPFILMLYQAPFLRLIITPASWGFLPNRFPIEDIPF